MNESSRTFAAGALLHRRRILSVVPIIPRQLGGIFGGEIARVLDGPIGYVLAGEPVRSRRSTTAHELHRRSTLRQGRLVRLVGRHDRGWQLLR